MNNLLSIFSDSPLKPIQYHMEKVHEYTQYLPEILDAVYNQNWLQAQSKHQIMMQLKNELNEISQQIHLQLPAHDMPACRSGILALLAEQSEIANAAKEVISIMVSRRVQIPEVVAESYYGFIYACLNATEKAKDVVDELEDLLANCGKGAVARAVQRIMMDLDQISNEVEQIQMQINHDMLAIEAFLPPVEVMFLHKIFEATKNMAGKAQLVGHRLQSLLQ